jgi:hypothetical protein
VKKECIYKSLLFLPCQTILALFYICIRNPSKFFIAFFTLLPDSCMRETLIPSRGKFSQVAKKMLGPLSSCWGGCFQRFCKNKKCQSDLANCCCSSLTHELDIYLILAKQENLSSNSFTNQLGKKIETCKTHLQCGNIRTSIPVGIGVSPTHQTRWEDGKKR